MSAAPKTQDDWMNEATAQAVASARQIATSGTINSLARVSSLSDIEWGWIVCAAIFSWIETKARQATAEGRGVEATIRAMHDRDPAPWESGAVASILPGLGEIKGIDWSKPVGEWTREQMIAFAWQSYRLTDSALAARDEGATDKIVRFARENAEREYSAANGGPLMSHEEMEEVPFDA